MKIRVSCAGAKRVYEIGGVGVYPGGPAVANFGSFSQANAWFDMVQPFVSDSIYALALPSVIIPEHNVVLFPHAQGFKERVQIESVDPFEFDPRFVQPK